MSYNRVVLVGTLLYDPELSYDTEGEAVCTFTLGVGNPRFKGETLFVGIRSEKRLAEVCNTLRQGASVLVEGELIIRKDEQGDKITEVRIEVMQRLDARKDLQMRDDRATRLAPEKPARKPTAKELAPVSSSGASNDDAGVNRLLFGDD